MESTLDALLASHARRTPDQVLFEFLDDKAEPAEALSFGQLHRRASTLAARLAQRAGSGEPVLVAAGPGSEHPVALFACFLAGATAVPVYPPQAATRAAMLETLAAICRACGARTLLATRAVAQDLMPALPPLLGADTPEWLDIDAPPLADVPAEGRLPGSSPQQAALLLYTSGSTGSPKGAILTHEGLLGNLRALLQGCGRGPEDVVCSWLPQSHIAGLFFRLLPVVSGGRGVLMPVQAFATNPTHWLKAISRHGATVTAAPDFAYAITAKIWEDALRTRPELVGLFDLTTLEMAVSGGEMVRASTLDAFGRAFAACGFDPAAFHPYYGLTETMCVSITQREAVVRHAVSRRAILNHRVASPDGEEDTLVLVGNGSPVGDAQVSIVDPAGRSLLAAGEVGEIWVRGGAVTPGYFGKAVADESWQGRLAQEGADTPPFFRTGDLGFLREGQLYVTGRLKELIIVRGKNHYPLDIEATVADAAQGTGMTQCVAFALHDATEAEGLALALELEDPPADKAEGPADRNPRDALALAEKLRVQVAQAHGLSIDRLFIMPTGTLPRTTTRKIPRLTCARLVREGQWQAWEVHDRGQGVNGHAQVAAGGAASTATSEQATDVARAGHVLGGLSGPVLEGAVLGQVLAQIGRLERVRLSATDLDRPLVALGLSSLHLARLAHELGQALALEVPLATLLGAATPRSVACACAALIEGHGTEVASPPIPWQDTRTRLTATLPSDIAQWPLSKAPAVVLTGATGFLGAWLAHALLATTDRPLWCLVRAKSDAHALERVRQALADGPGWQDRFAPRLKALAADLSAPALGLSPSAYAALADAGGTLLHNAADVNFVADYAQLAPSNVETLGGLMQLATAGGVRRKLHFVSTTAIFNGPGLRDRQWLRPADFPASPEDVHTGYARSKWVAEAVLHAASERGLPVHVHRPSVILCDSRSGASHVEDFSCRFLRGCVQMGAYPDAALGVPIVGVDQVASGIAASLSQANLAPVMHWSPQRPLQMAQALRRLAARGHAMRPLALGEWLDQVRHRLPPDNPLYPLRDFLLQPLAANGPSLLQAMEGHAPQIDNGQASALVPGLDDPEQSLALVDAMVGWLEMQGLLSAGTTDDQA